MLVALRLFAIVVLATWSVTTSHAANPPDIRVATIVCNSNTTGTFVVDAFTSSIKGLDIPEQQPCAQAIRTLFELGLRRAYSQTMIAPNRMEYSFTDEGVNTQSPAWSVVIIICDANTTGRFVVDGVSFSSNLAPFIAEQDECAEAITATNARGIIKNLFAGFGDFLQMLPLLIAPNRVVHTFVGQGNPPVALSGRPKTSIITCKVESNGLLAVDGASAAGGGFLGTEGGDCGITLANIASQGAYTVFAMEVLMPNRIVFELTDRGQPQPPASAAPRVSLDLCTANVTGVYTSQGGGAGTLVGGIGTPCPGGLAGVRAAGINYFIASRVIAEFIVLYFTVDRGFGSLLPTLLPVGYGDRY